jgi:hypothetical protein
MRETGFNPNDRAFDLARFSRLRPAMPADKDRIPFPASPVLATLLAKEKI